MITVKNLRKDIREITTLGSLPDIDTDFCGRERPRVKEYMEQRFGTSQVVSLGTYTTMQLKAAITDLARCEGIPIQIVRRITAKLRDEEGMKSVEDFFVSICKDTELREFVKSHTELINDMMICLNTPKAASIHACGTVIFPDEKISAQWVPIKEQKGLSVTEWEGSEIEETGFLKEDILGIAQLDKLADMLKLIEQNHGIKLDLYKDIPLDDPMVFEYIKKGFLNDVFHFGAKGLSSYCVQMQPESLDEMGICAALYRPGPIENNIHNEYILRKRGESDVVYPIGTKEILEKNLGLMCIEENCLVKTLRGDVKIKDVVENDYVLTGDNSYQRVLKVLYKGEKEVFRIHTSFGEDLYCTSDHKVMTSDGWCEVNNLVKQQSFIKGFWTEEERQTEKESSLKDWLIGYFITEGSCGSSPYYTVTDEYKADKLRELILQLWPNCIVECSKQDRINEKGDKVGGYRVQVKSKKGSNGYFSKDYKENPLTCLLKEEGIWGLNCYNKVLPKSCSIDTISGIIEGDGALHASTLAMNNEELIDQIYRKLLQYRIYCNKSYRKDGVPYISFNDVYKKLRYRITFPIERELKRSGYKIPINQIEFDFSLYNKTEISNIKTSIKNNRPKKIGSLIEKNLISNIKHPIWGEVLSIESVGVRKTYDLSIENNHEFVCGGLLVHNCYQEDIMRLCQELADFDLETTDSVRKCIGKKMTSKIKTFGDKFIEGYVKKFGDKDVTEEYARDLWKQMEEFGKYSFNKCLHGDEKILPNELTIKELYEKGVEDIPAITMDKYGNFIPTKVKEIRYAGRRFIYKIRTSDGAIVRCSGNHKFPTPEGCKYAFNLRKGDILYSHKEGVRVNVEIVSVDIVDVQPTYDVEIDHPEHNFVTGEGIVTCNSHAIAYSRNGYNCIWLKVHYPIEFWSVTFSYAELKDYPYYINEIQESGEIEIRPVDINKSGINIVSDIKTNSMYWALNSVKQCGEKAQQFIAEEREKNGEFFSLDEFIDRCIIKNSPVNKSVIENLIYSGAFDKLERIEHPAERLRLIESYRENKRVKVLEDKDLLTSIIKARKEKEDWWWTLQQKKLSGFATFDYEELINRYHEQFYEAVYYDVRQVKYLEGDNHDICAIIGGYVLDIVERKSKKGKFCILTLESNYEFINVIVFSELYSEYEEFLQSSKGNLLLVDGYIQWDKWKEEYCLMTNLNTSFTVLS